MAQQNEFDCSNKVIPVDSAIIAALRSIYSGGARGSWRINTYSYPYCDYKTQNAHIITTYCLPWEHPIKGLPVFTRRFLKTRWSLLYAHRLRESVRDMTVETADIFLILMAYFSNSIDTYHNIIKISLQELAEQRGVMARHGSSHILKKDLQKHLNHIGNLRMAVYWRSRDESPIINDFQEEPLFNIVSSKTDGEGLEKEIFKVSGSELLVCLLNKSGNLNGFKIYCKYFLQLNPYQYAFTKKLGVFWLIFNSSKTQATPREILDFCGEKANLRNPGQTVDKFIDAHNRLQDIGILEDTPLIEPFDRRRGYFDSWLDSPYNIRLSQNILKSLHPSKEVEKPLLDDAGTKELHNYSRISVDLRQLRKNPQVIRKMRGVFCEHQNELAKSLGISRQTLSKYERGISHLPKEMAVKLLYLWKGKT